MQKSTIIIILIIYFASIIAIGFFGMSVKVYDAVKYVNEISVTVEAEKSEMYDLQLMGTGKDDEGNNTYMLTVYFHECLYDENHNPYLPLSIIPHVTYTNGNVAGEEETIKYTIVSNNKVEENGDASLSDRGQLVCYKDECYFKIYVSPARDALGRLGTKSIITVWVADIEETKPIVQQQS